MYIDIKKDEILLEKDGQEREKSNDISCFIGFRNVFLYFSKFLKLQNA